MRHRKALKPEGDKGSQPISLDDIYSPQKPTDLKDADLKDTSSPMPQSGIEELE